MAVNLREGHLAIHITWISILVIIVIILGFFYGKTIDDLQAKYKKDNDNANRIAELTINQNSQLIDGRAVSELDKSSDIWVEAKLSPVSTYEKIKYSFQGNSISLSSGKIMNDTLTGLTWSAVSTSPIDNLFTTQNGSIAGTGALGFCQTLAKAKYGGYKDWTLPTQAQLMQSYINGSAGQLIDRPFYLWSATEFYGDNSRAWRVNLMAGDVASSPKANSSTNYVICVAKTK